MDGSQHAEPRAPLLTLTHVQPDGTARFAAAYAELLSELDWELLGREYCDPPSGGEFFGSEDVDALRDAGLAFAADVLEAVGGLPAEGARASLYVGVGVAELAPALAEAVVAGREVVLATLAGAECEELNRALAGVEARLSIPLFRVGAAPIAELPAATFDHGWLVSVLTDPDAFPALHDQLYDRSTRADGATCHGELAVDRRRARELLSAFLDRLRPEALVTTTDEELPLVRAELAARDARLVVPRVARLSAIVGDPVRIGCRVVRLG